MRDVARWTWTWKWKVKLYTFFIDDPNPNQYQLFNTTQTLYSCAFFLSLSLFRQFIFLVTITIANTRTATTTTEQNRPSSSSHRYTFKCRHRTQTNTQTHVREKSSQVKSSRNSHIIHYTHYYWLSAALLHSSLVFSLWIWSGVLFILYMLLPSLYHVIIIPVLHTPSYFLFCPFFLWILDLFHRFLFALAPPHYKSISLSLSLNSVV